MKNTEYILICDDDDGIANVTKIVLEDAGYAVISCSNGEEVLEMKRYDCHYTRLRGRWLFV